MKGLLDPTRSPATASHLAQMALIVVLNLAVPLSAMADGCYIPAQAIRKIPEIPFQRALLTWTGGVETLVISSALDSESQQLGWIIPLPDVPSTIEKETPGSLRTLMFCLQPRITHDPMPGFFTVLFWAFLANLVLGVCIFRREDFSAFLFLLLFLAFLWAAIFPASLGGAGRAVVNGSSVFLEKGVRAGAYDISVLRAQHPDDMDVWLSQNGFAALPKQAAQIAADYIRAGWVFAAIKLSRNESGANTPHPVRMTFKAEHPVYPLRLTSIAGGTTAFELFVVADKRVACGSLKEEFCDRFKKVAVWSVSADDTSEGVVAFAGEKTHVHIAHPSISRLMWDGCILTKLSGDIAADKMKADLDLVEKPFRFYQRHLYTQSGALASAAMLMTGLFGVALFVSMICFARRIGQPGGRIWYITKCVVPVVLLSVFCALLFFLLVPKLANDQVQVSRWPTSRMFPRMLSGAIMETFADQPKLATRPPEAIGEFLLTNALTNWYAASWAGGRTGNRVTGERLRIEDSPGNFTVNAGTTDVVIRVYDRTGCPHVMRFPSGKFAKE